MKNCLLGAAARGAFWLAFIFVVCFLSVHLVRLAKIGWNHQKNRTVPPEKPKSERPDPPPKPEERPPEPVYYIVERKRKRSRDSYSSPKEIKFK